MADNNPVLPSYILNTPDPAAAVRSNVELAVGVAQAQRQQAAAQQALQLHNLQMQKEQQQINSVALTQAQDQDFSQRLQALKQKPGGPTTEDIQDLGNTPTGLRHAEAIQQNFARVDEKEKFGLNDLFNRAYSAMDQGKYDIAQNVLRTASDAYKNSGQAQYAQMAKGYADGIDSDPNLVKVQMGMTLDKLDPKFTENFAQQKGAANKFLGEQYATKKAGVEAKDQAALDQSQIAQRKSEAFASNQRGLESQQTIGLNNQLNPEKIAQEKYKTIEGQNTAATSNITFQNEREKQAAALKLAQAQATKESATAPLAGPLAKTDLAQKTLDLNRAYDRAPLELQSQREALEQEKMKTQQQRFDLYKLPDSAAKQVSSSISDATNAQLSASRIHDLRTMINDKMGGALSTGLPARAQDFLRGVTGTDGDYQKIYSLYKEAIADKDLENASSHGAAAIIKLRQTEFPSPYASRELLNPILKDLEDLYTYKANVSNTTSDYLSGNGGDPGIARRGFVAGNRIVNPGDKLRNILDRPLPPKTELDNARQLKSKYGPDSPAAKALDDFYAKKGISLNG